LRDMVGVALLALLLILTFLSWRQHGFWKDKLALFSHALDVTENNAVAHLMVGSALLDRDQLDAAEPHLREALRLDPNYADAMSNIGVLQAKRGDYPGAQQYFDSALHMAPDSPRFHF